MRHEITNANETQAVKAAVEDFVLNSNLEALQSFTIEGKLDGFGAYALNLQANLQSLKEKKAALQKEQAAIEERLEKVENYLLTELGGQSFEGRTSRIEVRHSTSVEVNNMEAVPDNFKKIKVEVDKASALKELRAGGEIPGLQLLSKENIKIKPSKME